MEKKKWNCVPVISVFCSIIRVPVRTFPFFVITEKSRVSSYS